MSVWASLCCYCRPSCSVAAGRFHGNSIHFPQINSFLFPFSRTLEGSEFCSRSLPHVPFSVILYLCSWQLRGGSRSTHSVPLWCCSSDCNWNLLLCFLVFICCSVIIFSLSLFFCIFILFSVSFPLCANCHHYSCPRRLHTNYYLHCSRLSLLTVRSPWCSLFICIVCFYEKY